MAGRVLTQMTVSFLLGIMVARYRTPAGDDMWLPWFLWMISAVWMGWVGLRACQKPRYLWGLFRLAACLACFLLGAVRFHDSRESIHVLEKYLEGRVKTAVVGTICKKEEKNKKTIYYLNDSYTIDSDVKNKRGCLPSSQVLVYLDSDEYSIGDTIEVAGVCKGFDSACNEGNFDEKAYYYSKNIMFSIEAEEVTLCGHPRFLWRESLYRLREKIQTVYMSCLPKEEAGVLSVMVLGDKELLDTEIKKLYQQSGISHVLAISGLHVSILGMGIYKFLRKRGCPYLWAGIFSGSMVFCFGQVSGMELSAQRAILMFLVMLLGNFLGMAYDSVTALSLSALVQLWENPYCAWYAGFLFSYSAVLAVVVAAKVLAGGSQEYCQEKHQEKQKEKGIRLGMVKKTLVDTFSASGCIQLVTLPLTVYFYYEFPVYSVVINGLLLPLMGVLFMFGILGGLTGAAALAFGSVGAGGAVLDSIRAGTGGMAGGLSWLLLRIPYWLLRWNKWVCGLFQRMARALWITGRPPLWMMVLYYVLLVLVLHFIYRRENRWLPLGTVLAALLVLLTVRPGREFRVSILDVGQGDGICIETAVGRTFFVDGGSNDVGKVGEYRILSFLKCRGIKAVDGWFVSHADSDHILGLLELWESGYRIQKLFLSEWMVRDEAWEKLTKTAAEYGTEITYLKPKDVVGMEEMRLICLSPEEAGDDRNGNSMVLKLEYPGLTGFFGGDISAAQEKMIAEQYPELAVDLYKASHHGSNHSNSREILECLKPRISIVSCGEKNSYGHPGKEAVERMEDCGSEIFYTMKSGQLTVGCEEGRIWVKEYRHY